MNRPGERNLHVESDVRVRALTICFEVGECFAPSLHAILPCSTSKMMKLKYIFKGFRLQYRTLVNKRKMWLQTCLIIKISTTTVVINHLINPVFIKW